MELYWRDTVQVPPSEAEYLQMVSKKTGGLFRLILRLLRAMSPVEHVVAVNVDAISKLVDVMGLQFQILDDLKNICDEKVSATPTNPSFSSFFFFLFFHFHFHLCFIFFFFPSFFGS